VVRGPSSIRGAAALTAALLLGAAVIGSSVGARVAGAATKPAHASSTTTTEPAPANAAPDTTVRSWLAYHGAVFAGLNADLESVTAAANKGSVSSVTAGCDQLAADTATIEGVSAIPVARIQAQWHSALADFERAAADCVEGLTHGDARLSDRYKPEIESGITGVNRVVRELKKLE
jgi:hypothetical protein